MTEQSTPLRPARRTAPVRRQWGQAGQLLTTRETREQAARTQRHRAAVAEAERGAYEAWQHGAVVPHRITLALNLGGHCGPEVDRACHAAEPAVDEWEAGVRYPTWEQLCALAELTGYPVAYFTGTVRASDALRIADTTLIYHVRGPVDDPEPVLTFTPAAIAATLGGYCAGCMTPGPGAVHTCEQGALF